MSQIAKIAVHIPGEADLQIREVTLPAPSGHQVLVRVEASGLCRSQVRYLNIHNDGAPMLLGHEGIGVVEQVGSAVTAYSPGDRVIIGWLPAAGEGVRDPEWTTVDMGDGSTAESPDGVFTWATHTLVDVLFLVPLEPTDTDPALSLVGCALITGLGASIYAGGCAFGEDVVIIGVGGVGLAAVLGAVSAGAAKIIAIDVDDSKLELAHKLGATHAFNSTTTDMVAAVRELTTHSGAAGADLVVDCVGHTSTVNQGLESVRPATLADARGGRLVITGVSDTDVSFLSSQFVIEQKTIIGTLAGGMSIRDVLTTLSAIRAGKVDVNGLVTETCTIDTLADGVARLRDGKILGRSLVTF